MKKVLLALLLVAVLVLSVAACSSETTYTVTFDADGGSAVASQTVTSGECATTPTAPTKEGYTFAGWFVGENAYDFSTAVTADVTVKAKWTQKTYTVTFDADGGNAVDAQTVAHGATATAPTAPTKEGYTFAGWYIGETAYDFNTAVTADVTVKATWTQNSYTVTFDADGGSAVDTQTVAHGATATAPEAPTKEGYTFAGWFVGETAYDFSTAVTADVTVKATWTQNTYTFTFDTDGGSAVDALTVAHGATATAPADPTKEGYTFAGWFVGETVYDFETAVTADVTVKAKWTINSYTVTFNADNGTENNSVSVEHGSTATAPADPTKEGYTFAGWFVGETAYDFNTAVTANLTIKATWTLNAYTVTFDADGGSAVSAQTVNHGATATAPADPTKDGYVFAGWFVGETAYNFEKAVTGNVTLKAKWTLNSYTVIFNADNGTENTSVTVDHGTTVTAPADPSKEGYTFAGWFVGETAYDFNTAVTGNVTLKAAWIIKTYTITFDANGGSAVDAQTVNHGATATAPADPTKPGFALVAWKNGENVYDFATPVTGDITLIAEWKVDLPDLTAIAGTWTGKEQVVTTTTSYEFIIAADGTITATYSSGYTDITMTINYVIFEDNKLTINYTAGTTEGADMVFTLSDDNGILTTNAGVMGTQFSLYKSYTVIFDWGNYKSEVDPTEKTVIHGEYAKAPSKSWSGYEVKAWLLNGEAFDLDNTPITSDITLVANWGPKEYAVTYYDQNGEVLKVVMVKHGESVPESEVPTEGITTVPGAIFNGYWYGTAKSNVIVDVVGKTVTSAKNCYPGIINPMTDIDGAWTGTDKKGTWIVTVNAEEKSLTVTLNGEALTLAFFRFQELDEKTQLVFKYDSTTISLVYDSENGTLNGATSSSPNLTKMGKESYTVTFDSNGGSEVEAQVVEKDATAEEPAAPTKAGAAFDGWYLGEVKYDFATPVTGDITLTAKWIEVSSHTVTFDTGKTTTTQVVADGECAVEPETPTPPKSGQKFMGWYLDETKYEFTEPVTSDMLLVAKWGYEVTFYNQSKEIVKTLLVEVGTPVPENEIPAAEVNEGFVFTGVWHKSYTVSAAPVDIKANITGATKFYPGVIAESVTDLAGTWTGEKDGKEYSFTINVSTDENGKATGVTVIVIAAGVTYEPESVQYNASSSYMQLSIKYYKSGSSSISTFAINCYEDGTVKLGSPSIVLAKQ